MTCYDVIPIVITCKNRIRCLETTLRGLSATVPEPVPVYIVNDGCDNPEMIRYLTTTERVRVREEPYPTDHPQWARWIGPLPAPDVVSGIAGRATVILHKNSCGIQGFTDAIRLAFEETGAASAIKIQDDVALKPDWYRVMAEGLKCRAAGIVSGFRHFSEPVLAPTESARFVELVAGYNGGPLMGITRALATAWPTLLHTNITRARLVDNYWINAARRAGFKVLIANPGVAQHIGFRSEVQTGRLECMIGSDDKLRRLDDGLSPPFAFATEVRRFCGDNRVLYRSD